MNYALIENNTITNIIWLYPGNASDFPNAVSLDNVPAGIGDTYEDGVFYRNGERILTNEELLLKQNIEKDGIIAELDAAILDITYNNLLEG